MRYDFLMHGILALSALHLAEESTGTDHRKYSAIALGHHNQGLATYRLELGNITATNHAAVIGFSSITSTCSFAFSRPLTPNSTLAPIDDLARIFSLIRSWQPVVQAARKFQSEALAAESNDSQIPTFPAHAEEAFSHLHDLNLDTSRHADYHETEVYAFAIDTLKACLRSLSRPDSSPHRISDWVNDVPDRFVSLVMEHRTLAMIILAHYAVVLHRFADTWWLKAWGPRLLEGIWWNLEPDCRDKVSWPREMVGIGEAGEG